jgi:hypothetical protein
LPSPTLSISSFLLLDKASGDKCIEIHGNSVTDAQTRELLSKISSTQGFLILTHNGEVIGIIDPEKGVPARERRHKYVKSSVLVNLSTPKSDSSYGEKDLINLGKKYMSIDDRSAAEFYFEKVLDRLQKKLERYKETYLDQPMVERMIDLAELYYSYNDYDKSSVYYQNAWNYITKSIFHQEGFYSNDLLKVFGERGQLRKILRDLSEGSKKAGLSAISIEASTKLKSIEASTKPKLESIEDYTTRDMIAGASPVIFERYPYVEFPKQIPLNKTSKLRISITVDSITSNFPSFRIIASKTREFVPLVVSVTLTEPRLLQLIDVDSAVLHVPVKTTDSEPIEFLFRATTLGYQTIILQFYNPQQQMYIGEFSITTQVVPTTVDIAEKDSDTRYDLWDIKPSDMTPSQISLDNLTIEIRESKKYGEYQFDFYILSSDIDNEYYPRKYIASLPLKQKPEQEIRAIIHDIEKMIKYPLDLEESLSKKGLNLYESLFPNEVKDRYWNIKDKITYTYFLRNHGSHGKYLSLGKIRKVESIFFVNNIALRGGQLNHTIIMINSPLKDFKSKE